MSAIINASATTPEYLHALDQTTGIFSGGVSTPLTLAAWVKEVTDTTGTQCPISLNRGNTNNYFFSLRMEKGANSSACYASARVNAAGGGIAAGAELSSILDTWLLFVAVFDSGDAARRAYSNSATPGADETTSATPTSIDSVVIGAEKAFSDAIATLTVAEVAVWNTALSNANVTDLLTKTADQVAAANLQHYWPLYDDLLDDAGSVTLVDVNANVTLSTVDHPSLSASGTTIPIFMHNRQQQ